MLLKFGGLRFCPALSVPALPWSQHSGAGESGDGGSDEQDDAHDGLNEDDEVG